MSFLLRHLHDTMVILLDLQRLSEQARTRTHTHTQRFGMEIRGDGPGAAAKETYWPHKLIVSTHPRGVSIQLCQIHHY